jgi:hypothetical protein
MVFAPRRDMSHLPTSDTMASSIADELRGIDLRDRRLNRRSQALLETLAANPEASINGACDTWSETQAAYRFFDNPAVTPEAILQPHALATLARMRNHSLVLHVQDTTELDFSKHPPRDARCLDQDHRLGLYVHSYLAVTPDRQVLGVLGLNFFDRDPATLGLSAKRKSLPISGKETQRWLDGYHAACELAAACPQSQVVSVADREADIYDLFLAAAAKAESGGGAEWIVRSKQVRCTTERDGEAGGAVYRKVRDEVSALPLFTTRVLELPTTPKRKGRTATLEIRVKTVTVKSPHLRSHLDNVVLNVVSVQEVHGPGDGTDVSWWLLTSLPIATVDEVLKVIDCYVARWTVELFFRTWKTGCRVEDIRLETLARLKKSLAMYAIIAWRILALTYRVRVEPATPCTKSFSTEEWQVVWRMVKKQPLPAQPPTLAELVLMVARLGGYNNRKGDGPPGPQVLWMGLRRVRDFVLVWKSFHQTPEDDVCK